MNRRILLRMGYKMIPLRTDSTIDCQKDSRSMITDRFFNIAKQLNITPPEQDGTFCGICSDTRYLTPGNLFIAIQGEQFDGHDFILEAARKGAAGALVKHKIDAPIPQIVVEDTVLALGKITAHWRNQFNIPLIGVTGSNGKTTLKNMLASILQSACQDNKNAVLATDGNLNNHIGLPLTLARLHSEHHYAVIEMGMNHFGEIAYLTQLAKPTIAVITNAAEAHLEGLGNVSGVAKAKGEIFSGLPKEGVAILNRDDPHFDYWRSLMGNHRYVTFGLDHPADITATLSGTQHITLHTPNGNCAVNLPLLGRHNIMNALAATAASLAAGIDLPTIKSGLENVKPAPGRMQLYTLKNNINVIDDTYNANPFSLLAAVNALAEFSGKKIVVLGDMKELGSDAKQFHYAAGENIRARGIDCLFTFGNLSSAATEGFGEQAEHFTVQEHLIAALKPHLTQDVTLLVKGSRSMKMEKIVASIIPAEQLENSH